MKWIVKVQGTTIARQFDNYADAEREALALRKSLGVTVGITRIEDELHG